MAGVRDGDEAEIVDQRVEAVELDRQQGLVAERPDDERRHLEAREGALRPGGRARPPRRLAGTTISLARYQFSIAVSAPGADQSAR